MTPLVLALTLALPPLVSEEVLEPSVQNEVDHALALAPSEAWTAATNAVPEIVLPPPTNLPVVAVWPRPEPDIFGTNGLSATAIALKLVSTQRADGTWKVGTNDVTVTAVRILRAL